MPKQARPRVTTRTKAILAVILGNTIFGFSFIFSKMALQITVPSVMIAVRFLMAFFVLNLVVLVGRRIRVPAGPGTHSGMTGDPRCHAAASGPGTHSGMTGDPQCHAAAAGPGTHSGMTGDPRCHAAASGPGTHSGMTGDPRCHAAASGPDPGASADLNQRSSAAPAQTRPLVEFSLRGKPLRYVLLLALFQPILYFLCESYGIVYTSSSFAGTIIAVIPIAGIVFDVAIMHSRVRLRQIICAVLSALGVAITTIGAEGMRSSALGLLILLGAVTAGALFYVFSKKSGDHYNALEQTYVMFALGSLVYVTFALIQCRGQYQTLILDALAQPVFLMAVLYLAVLSSVAAFIALNWGTVRVTVSEASIFANLTTVISIIAGVVFLHETFSLFQVLGALLIIGSVYVASRN